MNNFSIRNTKIITPAGDIAPPSDLHVVDGLIAQSPAKNAEVIDGSNLLCSPGFIDLYARLREPGYSRKGTIKTETIAALKAGFTTVCCAPDTDPAIDSTATVELIRQRTLQANGAHVIPIAALTIGLNGERLSEMATLYQAGCLMVSNADKPMVNSAVMLSAMEYAASFDIPIQVAPLDAHIGSNGCAHAGATATRLGLPSIQSAAETVALAGLLELCRNTGARLHFSRLTSARSIELVRQAKYEGLPITADVGIHHLFFTDEQLAGFDSNFHSAVPFRSVEDRAALRDAVADNTIDAICSDHAPQDTDAKLAPFPNSGAGLAAYDVFLPLLLALPDLLKVPLPQITAKVTIGPAAVIAASENSLTLGDKLPARPTGAFNEAELANLVMIDPAQVPETDTSQWLSQGHNTPLAGLSNLQSCTGENIPLNGSVRAACVNGNLLLK